MNQKPVDDKELGNKVKELIYRTHPAGVFHSRHDGDFKKYGEDHLWTDEAAIEILKLLEAHYQKKYIGLLPKKDTRKHPVEGVDQGIQIGWNQAIDEALANMEGSNAKDQTNL